MLDRQTLKSSLAAIYDRLDAQNVVVDSFRSLEEALQEKEVRNDRLDCELRSFQELAPPLSEYVLHRYERLQEQYDAAIQLAGDFERELGIRADQS